MPRITPTAILAFLLILTACSGYRKEEKNDFLKIVESDTLRVLTLNTSTSYFIYRDIEMGYHYDMVKNFADENNLNLKIIVAKNNTELLQMLQDNRGDMVAYNIPVENEMKDSLLYCGLTDISHQVLIQRAEKPDTILKDVTDLIGRDVYVLRDSKYESRMNNLNQELGGGIHLKYVDKDTLVVEDLIRMVSSDIIRYTVAEENVAQLNQTYFRNINIDLQVSFDQRTSWVVRKDSPILADSLNSWYERVHKEPGHMRFAKRYFEESKGYSTQGGSFSVSLMAPGQISQWDQFFKEYGKQYRIDWRLLAAIAYNESTFNPEGQSWAGAGGLMGVMPATAKSMGIDGMELFLPDVNVMLGSQYLRKLLDLFSTIGDESERIKMALASYNGGMGHISDARALAEKYGADNDVWNGSVEKYLQLKRLEQYYNDPVCKTGYFRADETVNYVRNVMERWEEYKKKV